MNRLPPTVEKTIRFLAWIVNYNQKTISKDDYEAHLMMFFGSNHQTLASNKKLFYKTRILVADTTNLNVLIVDEKKLKNWVLLLREFYIDWDGWHQFNYLFEGADKFERL